MVPVMRGLPWLRLLAIVVIFTALGWPVWRLTRPLPSRAAASGPPVHDGAAEAAVILILELGFAGPPPTGFQVKQAARVVLQAEGSKETVFHARWTTTLPKEGLDLTLKASWPPDGPHAAVRINVSLPDGRQIKKIFWAEESLVELVTVPGADEETS